MKRNFLYSCLIALASLGFVACDSDNDEQEAKVPSGATPTPLRISHPLSSSATVTI